MGSRLDRPDNRTYMIYAGPSQFERCRSFDDLDKVIDYKFNSLAAEVIRQAIGDLDAILRLTTGRVLPVDPVAGTVDSDPSRDW